MGFFCHQHTISLVGLCERAVAGQAAIVIRSCVCVQEQSGALKFAYNAQQPLNPEMCDAMLVDEVSMLDLPLAAALLSAISSRHPFQLVLTGKGPI